MISIRGKRIFRRQVTLTFALLVVCSATLLATDTITGVVRDQTSGRPATGERVILLALDQAHPTHDMEEGRAVTDSRGSFTLKLQDPGKLHLVRAIHQGVNYDQRASAGDVLSIDVFDSAAKVQGLAGSIEIIRAGTHGTLLHVSDMIEIRNNSSPPLTLAGERTFEVYLPALAKIDSVLAAGPGKIGVMISATRLADEPGHYAVNFPLRPGATKFAFNYDVPYAEGRAAFRARSVHPLQQLAVMLPPTMKFTSGSKAFRVLATGNSSYQVEAANEVNAGEGLEFEISGAGVIPALEPQARSPAKAEVTALPAPAGAVPDASASQAHTKASSAAPAYELSPASRPQWWIFGACAAWLLGACGLWLWRRRPSVRAIATRANSTKEPSQTQASAAEAFRRELSQLEIERSQGGISGDEYDSAKQALEGTVRRALARTGGRS